MPKMRQLTALEQLSVDICNGKVEKYSNEGGEQVLRKALLDAVGGEWDVYSFQENKYKVFKIMSELLTISLANLVMDRFNSFVETKDVALGDMVEFRVANTDLFKVGYVADGTNDLRRQRLISGKLPMSGFQLGVKIYEEFEMFLAGRIDWVALVEKVAKSMEHELATIILKEIEGAYNGLDSNFVYSGTYSETELTDMIQLVKAQTGQEVAIYGTHKALSKIKTASSVITNTDKEDIRNFGYVKVFEGVPCIELPQALNSDFTYKVNGDVLYVIPNGEKILKMGFEGDAYVQEVSDPGQRLDKQMEYLMTRKVQMGVLKSARYGVLRITGA